MRTTPAKPQSWAKWTAGSMLSSYGCSPAKILSFLFSMFYSRKANFLGLPRWWPFSQLLLLLHPSFNEKVKGELWVLVLYVTDSGTICWCILLLNVLYGPLWKLIQSLSWHLLTIKACFCDEFGCVNIALGTPYDAAHLVLYECSVGKLGNVLSWR